MLNVEQRVVVAVRTYSGWWKIWPPRWPANEADGVCVRLDEVGEDEPVGLTVGVEDGGSEVGDGGAYIGKADSGKGAGNGCMLMTESLLSVDDCDKAPSRLRNFKLFGNDGCSVAARAGFRET